MKILRLPVALFLVILTASACGSDNSTAIGDGTWPDKITFGFVPSQEQDQLQDDIKPLMAELENALGIEVEGFVTTDYTGLVTAMGTGQADLGAVGPFGYTLAKEQFGNIEALLLAIRYGSATYHGQWFTNDPSICQEAPASVSYTHLTLPTTPYV